MGDVLYKYGWLDDKVLPVDELVVPVSSPSAQYGMGLFEGIRGYPRPGGVAVVALREHMERLYQAAELSDFNFQPPILLEDAIRAVLEILQQNEVKGSCYIRPYLFHQGTGHAALRKGIAGITRLSIHVEKWGTYLSPDGVRCTLSGIPKPMYAHAQFKTSGNYVLCTEAKSAAVKGGFDNCIMKDCRGRIAEGASENLFLHLRYRSKVAQELGYEENDIVEDVFVEPQMSDAPILPGITARILRETIGPSLGIKFVQRVVTPLDMVIAEGFLLCGTAAEVTHAKSLDDHLYNDGVPTRLMKSLIDGYRALVEGRSDEASSKRWIIYIKT